MSGSVWEEALLTTKKPNKASALVKTKQALRLGVLESRFLEAAEHGDLDEIVRCIAVGVNPNCLDKGEERTALHIAVERGDKALTSRLLRCKDIKLSAATLHGYMPIHIACIFNQSTIIKQLLEAGANPNSRDRLNQTPLHMAVFSQSLIIAKLLLSEGANVNAVDVMERTPLYISILDKLCLPLANLLLKHGADINFYHGNMPLFLESVHTCHTVEQEDAVKYLIEKGVDINAVDKISKRNALHCLALSSYLPLLPILLDGGVDQGARDYLNKTPLDIAVDHCNWVFAFAIGNYKTQPQLFVRPLRTSSMDILSYRPPSF